SSSNEKSLKVITTEENSASREGMVIDTDQNVSGGNLAVFKNKGVKKAGVRHDGTFEVNQIKSNPIYGTQATITENRGLVYLYDGQGGATKVDDELRVVIQKSNGTFVTKRIQLLD
ncbi:hypothetical protein ACQH8C_23650, partial [Escherichia coli]|uniref:hypothetical protein n=1 Tax=Escherichia coli TaxID=562 RepID=UPI003CF9434B